MTPSREIILRAVQKDEEYINILMRKLVLLVESISDKLHFSINSDKIEFFSKFLFYFVCYHINKEKLSSGEEYAGIFKIFLNKKSVLFYVLMMSMKNYLIKSGYKFFNSLYENSLARINNKVNKTMIDTFITKFQFPSLDDISSKLEEIEFCYFFINGNFYNFIQRIFNIRYNLKSDNKTQNDLINSDGFKILGYIISFKLICQFIIFIKHNTSIINKIRKDYKNNLPITESQRNLNLHLEKKKALNLKPTTLNRKQCLLCMETRKNTSATLCGHLFCWECITNYLQSTPACPFCRSECYPQGVILIHNLN